MGGDLAQEFPEVPHTVPVLSLDKSYTTDEILAWTKKLQEGSEGPVSFIVEEKIDGAGIVLYYQDGLLARALSHVSTPIGDLGVPLLPFGISPRGGESAPASGEPLPLVGEVPGRAERGL